MVGAGAMGRWFADAVADEVAFLDVDPDAAAAAAEATGGRAVGPDTTETFEAVCVAVPLPAAAEALGTYAGRAERAVFDVAGVMAEPLAAAREAAPDAERASLHPLFAPSNAPGTVAAVVDEDGPGVRAVLDRLADRDNRIYRTTAAEHDDAMRTVQARTHAAVLAFALAAEDVPEPFHTPISAGLSELVAEVTGGEPRVYADVQAAFDGADDVAAAAREIADADPERFARLYERAGAGPFGAADGADRPRTGDAGADST